MQKISLFALLLYFAVCFGANASVTSCQFLGSVFGILCSYKISSGSVTMYPAFEMKDLSKGCKVDNLNLYNPWTKDDFSGCD